VSNHDECRKHGRLARKDRHPMKPHGNLMFKGFRFYPEDNGKEMKIYKLGSNLIFYVFLKINMI
jgi:hypothetical protein